jgi:hypothetical protein
MATQKRRPTGNYAVGYAKPPKRTQFRKGESGNLKGRPRGLPTAEQLLLEEAARIVKVRVGEEVVRMPKQRALMRKLIDLALQGDIGAIRLTLAHLGIAHAAAGQESVAELPLTEDELALLKLRIKKEGRS